MLNDAAGRRFCVITPYYRESRALLERCIASVARQSQGAIDHILVADGFPQDWLDTMPVRHIRLDKAHADYGNVARGMGAMMAMSEKYDGICFLDADNWFDDDHIETCLEAAAAAPDAAYVIAQRHFVRPDATIMAPVIPADMPFAPHVDTNCYLFLPGSFHLLHYWCTMPRELASHGDMLFFHILKNTIATPPAITTRRTVKYLCMFGGVYLQHNEPPPENAKPYVDWTQCTAWLDGLSEPDMALVQRLCGLALTRSNTVMQRDKALAGV